MSTALPPEAEAAIKALITAVDQCLALGELTTARALCREGLAAVPDNAALKFRRGRIFVQERNFAAAAADFRDVAAALPDNAQVWLELGRAAARTLAWREAGDALDRSLALAGPRADVLAELGHIRANGDEQHKAIDAFRSSLAINPDSAEVWNDLGGRLLAVGAYDEAARSFAEVLKLEPAHKFAAANLAVTHEWRGEINAAIAARRAAVAAAPDEPAAHQALGAALLSFGLLVEGWLEQRWRFRNPAHRGWHRGIPKPMLNNNTLAGQRVLIWSDQGLGDQILAAGLLKDAARHAAHVVFACEARLMPLIARSFPNIRVVPITEVHRGTVALSDVDVSASISEIGPILRRDWHAFPTRAGYLKPDPAKVGALRARYEALPGQGPVIGLSWRSVNDVAGKDKSVGLVAWAPILAAPARFVSLQYGDVRTDIGTTGGRVFHDVTVDPVADIEMFAAQVAAMDRVISISNTTVHMAGALGVPTLCLTPRVEGRPWYWFAGAETSPWYPSVRHIWQAKRGVWDDAIAAAASGL